MKRWKRNLLLVLLLLFPLSSLGQSSPTCQIVIDMGWLAASQEARGWLVTNAPPLYKQTRTLRQGDLLLKIDGHDLSILGPLALVSMLDDVPFRQVPIVVERDGSAHEFNVFQEGVVTDGTIKTSPTYLAGSLQARDQPSPPFSLEGIDDKTVSLNQYRGRWLLVNVWGTWCAGCMQELPALDYLSSHYRDRVTVVGIAINDSRITLKQFVAQKQLTYPILLGGTFDEAFAHAYGIRSAPVNVLVAPDSSVRFAGIGPGSLKSAVQMLAGCQGVAVPSEPTRKSPSD
jgi:peroxiredoxin